MKHPVQAYQGKGVIVRFDPTVCIHAGNCVRSLRAVFDVTKRPWVNMDGADAEAMIKTVQGCPSGALTVERTPQQAGTFLMGTLFGNGWRWTRG